MEIGENCEEFGASQKGNSYKSAEMRKIFMFSFH